MRVLMDSVLDLLRYHLFTIGYAWKSDYGDPDVEEDFEFIYKWSPYHNVRDGKTFQYPAILRETSDHDDRVYPFPYMYIDTLVFRCTLSSSWRHCNTLLAKRIVRRYC